MATTGKKQIKDTIEIHAPPDRLWKVLTAPEFTEKYMFGCRTVSDWKLGSPLTWETVYEGKKLIAVKGAIAELEPGKRLRYTVFDPNSQYTDVPSNYLSVTYALTPTAGGTQLDVVQDGYDTVEDGEKRYQDSAAGWGSLLTQIKALAEGA